MLQLTQKPDLAPSELRKAFGLFATGVTVVTFPKADGEQLGMTVNSFCSLSLDPPLVSWAIRNNSRSFADACDARRFAINVLGEDHRHLSEHYAGRAGCDLPDQVLQQDEDGIGIIPGALVSFCCQQYAVTRMGDHALIVGQVLRVVTGGVTQSPLLFYGGKYAQVQPAAEA
jgi:flavin reductase (DIM6/NTAB) family NADH-FMN oxidoreductase RutF